MFFLCDASFWWQWLKGIDLPYPCWPSILGKGALWGSQKSGINLLIEFKFACNTQLAMCGHQIHKTYFEFFAMSVWKVVFNSWVEKAAFQNFFLILSSTKCRISTNKEKVAKCRKAEIANLQPSLVIILLSGGLTMTINNDDWDATDYHKI